MISNLPEQDEQTHLIIGAAMEVHGELGHGFLEAVYHGALTCEFRLRRIPFECEVALPVAYKGVSLGFPYRADFVCFGSVIVETKALGQLTTVEEAQVINYLKASGYSRACCSISALHRSLANGSFLRIGPDFDPQISQINADFFPINLRRSA